MDIVNKHEVHGKSYRKLAAEYGVSGSGCLRTFLTERRYYSRNFDT